VCATTTLLVNRTFHVDVLLLDLTSNFSQLLQLIVDDLVLQINRLMRCSLDAL
jgi:hypothetical protein